MDVVSAHLGWLAQRGLAARTVYHRERYLARLEEWLAREREIISIQPRPDRVTSAKMTPGPGLLDVTRSDLLAWRATLTRLAPNSVNAAISHIRSFYAWAVDEDLIPASPATRIPVPKRPRGLPRPVAEDTLTAVLDAAPARIRPWLVLAGWCGLRACEIAGLRAENIRDRDARPSLIVDAASAKGGRERSVPLTPFVVAELRAAALPARGLVFGRADGTLIPLTPHAVSASANHYLRSVGAGVTLHQFRHRCLSQAWRGSHDLLAVSRLAGHANVATTTVYTKLDDDAVAAAVLSIPAPARLRAVGE